MTKKKSHSGSVVGIVLIGSIALVLFGVPGLMMAVLLLGALILLGG